MKINQPAMPATISRPTDVQGSKTAAPNKDNATMSSTPNKKPGSIFEGRGIPNINSENVLNYVTVQQVGYKE